MLSTKAARESALLLIATAVVGLGSAPAFAQQDPGRPSGHSVQYADWRDCPLTRIGAQFVRCDNLTGAGVPAPSWVPEG